MWWVVFKGKVSYLEVGISHGWLESIFEQLLAIFFLHYFLYYHTIYCFSESSYDDRLNNNRDIHGNPYTQAS